MTARGRGRIERGFTLVELLITAALAGVVAGGAAAFYIGAWRDYIQVLDRADLTGRAAGAIVSIARDVRGAAGVVAAGSGRLDIWADDRNGDGFPQPDEIVTYRLDGADLVREAEGARVVLATGLTRATFATDLQPDAPDRARFVDVVLEPDGAPPLVTGVAVWNAWP